MLRISLAFTFLDSAILLPHAFGLILGPGYAVLGLL